MARGGRPEIVIHAGMGKAGSTAIQNWLRRSGEVLGRNGYTLAVVRRDEGGALLTVGPYAGGSPSSGPIDAILRDPDMSSRAARKLTAGLASLAETHGRVLMTGEALSRLFVQRDRVLLGALEGLARDHEVRIGYYVRPQHTALEAAWRQWGFRSGVSPSEFVSQQGRQLHYLDILRGALDGLPSATFTMRPFRRDLLESGDVVRDFARHVLGIDPEEVTGDTSGNVGLPLTVVNALSTAPPGLFWDSPHDNRRLNRMKALFDGRDPLTGEPPLSELVAAVRRGDDKSLRGRHLLQAWAHCEFAAENRALIEAAGWPAGEWVPDPGEPGDTDLAALDSLWAPALSAAEQSLLHLALQAATPKPPPRPRRDAGTSGRGSGARGAAP